MRLKAYTSLFKNLAATHVDIRYTPENGRFLRILISSDPIAQQIDLSSFYAALKSKLKAPAGQPFLVLQNYQLDYGDNQGDWLTRQPQGAFYVLRKEKLDDVEARDTAIDECERIAEEILAAVVHQHQATHKIRITVADAFAEHVGPIGDGHVGVRMNFSWTESATPDLTYKPTQFSPVT